MKRFDKWLRVFIVWRAAIIPYFIILLVYSPTTWITCIMVPGIIYMILDTCYTIWKHFNV